MGARNLHLFSPAGFVAGADLRSAQFRFVRVSDDWEVDLPSADGQFCVGVLQNDPNEGEGAAVEMKGMSRVVVAAGEVLVAGDFVKADADGYASKAEMTSTGADVGDHVLGYVVEGVTGSTPAGVLATVILQHVGRAAA